MLIFSMKPLNEYLSSSIVVHVSKFEVTEPKQNHIRIGELRILEENSPVVSNSYDLEGFHLGEHRSNALCSNYK